MAALGPQLLASLAIAAAYLGLAALSPSFSGSAAGFVGIWLPSGLIAALAIRLRWRCLPGVLLGAVLSKALFSADAPHWSLLVMGESQILEAVAVILLAPRWMGSGGRLSSVRDQLGLVGAAAIGVGLHSLLGGLALPLLEDGPLQLQPLRMWLGGMAGVAMLTPPLLLWSGPERQAGLAELRRPRFWWLLGVALAIVLLMRLQLLPVFSATPAYVLLPLLFWIAFHQPAAATSLITLVVVLALTFTGLQGHGFHHPHWLLSDAFEAGQVRLFGIAATTLMVQLVNDARNRLAATLSEEAMRLEQLVAERTQQLARANARLQALSQQDGLTGIANRRYFNAVLRREWRRARRQGQPLALALVDVDHFKPYNDSLGHQAGDLALRRVADTLAGTARRAEDLVARYGGEEFAVILPGIDEEGALVLAERLRLAVEKLALPHPASPVAAVITVSVGVACQLPGSATSADPEELVREADALLFAAKASGRNQVARSPSPGDLLRRGAPPEHGP
jgi:diguanylate cyclase (GGDEF)-like protein